VRELAEAMGGRAAVAITPGRGAAFAIDLDAPAAGGL
jgi:signal transduction histidine kinase